MIWQPYSEELLGQLPHYCTVGRLIWPARVPLICFNVVEWHLPDRVMRQFGFHQGVPENFDTSRELHRFEFRTATNWTTKHRCYIDIWNQRYGRLIQGPEDANPGHEDAEYMFWYRRISRRFMCRRLLMSDYMVIINI